MRITARESFKIYLRLLTYIKPYWGVFALAIFGMLALASTEWLLPALLKHLIDIDFDQAAAGTSVLIPALFIGLFLIRGILSYTSTVALHWIAHRNVMDLRGLMFGNLIALPAGFFDHNPSGTLISKFTFDVTQVAQATTRVLTVLVKDSAVIVALLCYLFYLNWRLAGLMLLLAPPVGYVVYRVSKRMRDMSRRLQSSVGNVNQIAEEGIAGHREIKIFGGQPYEMERFGQAINAARKYQMKIVRTAAATVPIIQTLVAIGIAVMIVLALREAAGGAMSRGDFVAFITTTALLLPPTKRLAGVNEFLQRGLAAAESVFALMDEPVEARGGTLAVADIKGDIEFRKVTQVYDEEPVLREIDLRIKNGESIAIVGPSGGGKSTLLDLVARFYVPTSGQVLIDGHSIDELDLEALRNAIAYVGQHIVLFDDTVFNNIAYGSMRDVDPARVRAVADAAFVTEFVEQLPDGFDTVIGENGLRLSGGQRQRIAIARALLKDAPILLLDEATSALDAEAERQIKAAFTEVRRGRTSLIVAHRLSTVESVGRIIVIEAGRLVESGTHAELLASGGPYARLYAPQFDEVAEAL